MGKSLIIKGADFSANGIQENISLDITSILAASPSWKPQYSLRGLDNTAGPDSNQSRCCFVATTFASLGIDITGYKKLIFTVKPGFDYVFATGPQPNNGSVNWQSWDGAEGGHGFVWVSGNQQAIATLDNTTLAISFNLRYDNNTTTFGANTVLTDIVESVELTH